MTLQIELPPDVEARYAAEAQAKGVPLERHVRERLIEHAPPLAAKEGELQPDEREKRIEELFEAFDSQNVPAGVSEDAFHRENWYR